LLLHHFGSVPTLSLPANLLVVPLTTAALGAGLAGSIVLPILPWLAGLFGASAYLATAAALEVVRWSAELPPGSIEIPTISLESMLLLLGTLVVVALARSRRQLLFRGGIWAVLLSMTLAIEARADRLRNESASILFWYRSKEGSSIARVEEDTLRIYTAVARAAGRSEEMLRRRMGARAVVVIALDSTATDTNDIEPMLINETPAEFLLGNPGVILSCSAQPAPAVVTIDGRQILRLPLGRSPERAMIFRAGARWEVIQWR
jgi:hypothetical protein